MQNSKEDLNFNEMYGKYCKLPKEEFLKKYNLSLSGLNQEQVNESFKKYGSNKMKKTRTKKWYNYFFGSLFSPFNSILLGIVIVLIYTDIILQMHLI